MLQKGPVWCSVLQRVAVFCSVLQCAAVCCSVLQCAAVWCSVVQCGAVCCSVLQCVAVCCSVLQRSIESIPMNQASFTKGKQNRETEKTKQRLVTNMGWLHSVGSIKLQVSFAEYHLFYRALLQKRPKILSILLTKATP